MAGLLLSMRQTCVFSKNVIFFATPLCQQNNDSDMVVIMKVHDETFANGAGAVVKQFPWSKKQRRLRTNR